MASWPRWGSTDLPQVDAAGGIAVVPLLSGSWARTVSGALKADVIAVKHAVRLRWSGLTAAERAVIVNALAAYRLSPQALALPDGRVYLAVLARDDSLEDRLASFTGSNPLYDMALDFEEA